MMASWELEYMLVRIVKPVIAAEFRRIYALLEEAGQQAIEGGADEEEVRQIIADAQLD